MKAKKHEGTLDAQKQHDVRKQKKFKQRFQQLLEDESTYTPEEKHSKITKSISKHLSAAKDAKAKLEGVVTIDRKIKLVGWACYTAMKYIADVYQPGIKERKDLNRKEKDRALRDSNRVCGDLCRYLSVSLAIMRNDRPPNAEEDYTQKFWATKSIELYDNSDLDLGSYDVRIKQLFDSTTQQVLLSVILDLRKLCTDSASNKAKRLPPIPNRTIFVEERVLYLKKMEPSSEMLQGFSSCVLECVNYAKHNDVGVPPARTTVEKAVGQVRKQWEKLKSGIITTEEADAYLFGLVMLAILVKSGPSHSLPFCLSLLVKTPPLWDRLQVLINPEKPIQWSSSVTEYVFLNSMLEKESLRIKLQKLNSRPLSF